MAIKTKALFALALLLVVPIVAFGRIRQGWTYAQLQEQSDLVIIAKPALSVSLEEKVSLPNISPATPVVGIKTKLEIRVVLKGDRSIKNVLLHHYALQDPADGQTHGAPQLISFDVKSPTCYLMFLKHEANGSYVPVTGQTDPAAESIIKLESSAR